MNCFLVPMRCTVDLLIFVYRATDLIDACGVKLNAAKTPTV